MWVICELEGGTFEAFHIELETSAIPKIWLLMVNGKDHCYWPRTNAGQKIRSCAKPEADWNIYKCRILMNGGEIPKSFVYKAHQ